MIISHYNVSDQNHQNNVIKDTVNMIPVHKNLYKLRTQIVNTHMISIQMNMVVSIAMLVEAKISNNSSEKLLVN